jgi:hypothetical protein
MPRVGRASCPGVEETDMAPDFNDRTNKRLWTMLIVLGAVLCVIGWYRYFTSLS